MQVTQNKPASAKERLSSHIAFRVVLAVGAAGLEDVGDNAPRACAPPAPRKRQLHSQGGACYGFGPRSLSIPSSTEGRLPSLPTSRESLVTESVSS